MKKLFLLFILLISPAAFGAGTISLLDGVSGVDINNLSNITLANTGCIKSKDAAGTDVDVLCLDANDDLNIGNATGVDDLNINAAKSITVQTAIAATDAATVNINIIAQAAQAAASTNLDGGDLNLTGGAGASGSAGDADGGDVVIAGGAGFGTGEVGHVEIVDTVKATGSDPVLSSCGTSPSIIGSDFAGKITIGTTTTTSCTVTFNAPMDAAPACVVTGDNTAIGYAATTTTTVMTLISSADMDSDVVSYICIGL